MWQRLQASKLQDVQLPCPVAVLAAIENNVS
jgi:hypothetical protein